MKHLHTLLFLTLFVNFAYAGPSYRLVESPAVVPLQVRNKLMLVEGRVNGKSGYFLFDTGASELILNQAYFPRHKHYNPKSHFASASGHIVLHGYAYISSFSWGSLRREEFFAPRIDLLALESQLGEQLLGIIGYDVLQHADLEIDYYQGAITLLRPGSDLPALALRADPDYAFDFQMDRHLPVLNARLGDAEGLRMAIDSGSSVNVCANRLKGKLKTKALKKRTVGLQGAAGILQQSPYFIMESLEVENTYSIAYCRVALGNVEAFDDYGFHIDGLLGVNFFRLGRVYFSYQAKRILVWLEENDYTLRHSSLRPLAGLRVD
ncbi:MAG: aspartyl protease family protein [Lewinellaceae bacterium]|nr:aspartyl protease family protein [Phaeodactylibacter sp.]MCB9037360.1 aspartyl protease family protein [Lewinellaceae bacterium]